MSFFGTATASSTATADASSTTSASARSNISQEVANQLALETAQNTSKQIAYNIALSQLDKSNNTSNTLYVALLFTQSSYDDGMIDTLELIQREFPNSKIVYEKYVVDGTPLKTDEALTDFINKYPTGNRVTISGFTSVLNEILNYFEKNNLDIFSLSVSATSILFQTRKNLFTYAYYLDKSIMTSFLIIEEYALKNIIILIDKKSVSNIFFDSNSIIIEKQNSLLNNLPLTIYDLSDPNQIINIPENSFVYLLADTLTITDKYINTIKNAFINNTSSCIFLTDINYDIKDIFGNIPAFVSVLCPLNYTTTGNKVYNNLKNKNKYDFGIYPFYDIVYTLQFMSDNGILVNNANYIDVQPFQTIPEAYSNSLILNKSINGFNYGAYNVIFTSNTILNSSKLLTLYNQYNNNDGTIYKLPDSQSVFLTYGIVPFYQSEIYYWQQRLIKIYNNEELKYIKFDGNITKDDTNNFIAVSQQIFPKFIVNYDTISGLFSYLKKIYNNKEKTNPQVNLRMSKIDENFYL